ncbi:uncharacterized protein LOC122539419 isoform X4 [Chiloscyllium plagiosum]|uniref:uncharacterized protein LOC122539419 isoform X4 n=1 Tax=Chiloscyllium plagiosum TaxID=36176 RepID=UPI001CB80C34|nr:uncharacterized protein LOC122539419 isoform X4 [Chiloscyllium plagiosum]
MARRQVESYTMSGAVTSHLIFAGKTSPASGVTCQDVSRCLRTLLLETNPLIELPIELDPIHPIKMVKQTLKIIKIKNSLGNCFEQQSEKKLQKAMEPLMSVRGHMFCCKSPPKPVLCSKMNIIRNNVLQRSDRKQVFEVKANVKDPNDTLHQRKKVTGKMFPVLSKLMEDQNCPEKMQRKKKELKKPNIKSDKKDFEQLPLVNIQQKNEDKLKSGMEVNIQKRSDEETVKEPKICKTKDVELKLQHRIQQYQQLRKKRRRPRKAVSPEDANAEVENLRKSLSRLKMERQSPMEYRLCAFIGEYSS